MILVSMRGLETLQLECAFSASFKDLGFDEKDLVFKEMNMTLNLLSNFDESLSCMATLMFVHSDI